MTREESRVTGHAGHGSIDWWVTWVTGQKVWPIVISDARSFSDADVDSGDEQDAPGTPGEQQDGDISSEPEFLDETGRLTTHVAITK